MPLAGVLRLADAGDAPEMWLLSMARAVRLSVLHAGGMVEAFYQLHSQRLKFLLRDQTNLGLLKTVAR